MKECFVISPIGESNSPIRKHADDVFDFIINPAMEECNIRAFRSDHLDKPGRITEQMFQFLYTADLCIAVLTGYNPNVFYELAIAQSAQRPVIILIETGQKLPFDIGDLRCVFYDLEIRSYNERTHIKRIINYVKEFEAAGWKSPLLFSHLNPIHDLTLQNNKIKYFERSMEYGGPHKWLELLEKTHQVFDLMGFTLGAWKGNKGLGQLLPEKARGGCKVRVLLIDTDNPVFRPMINPLIRESIYEDLSAEAEMMFHYFLSIASEAPNIEVRKLRFGCPHYQLTRTDQNVTLISYLYSEKYGDSPLWQCDHDSGLYSTMTQEFDSLWNANNSSAGA
jgi:hypothetical protein